MATKLIALIDWTINSLGNTQALSTVTRYQCWQHATYPKHANTHAFNLIRTTRSMLHISWSTNITTDNTHSQTPRTCITNTAHRTTHNSDPRHVTLLCRSTHIVGVWCGVATRMAIIIRYDCNDIDGAHAHMIGGNCCPIQWCDVMRVRSERAHEYSGLCWRIHTFLYAHKQIISITQTNRRFHSSKTNVHSSTSVTIRFIYTHYNENRKCSSVFYRYSISWFIVRNEGWIVIIRKIHVSVSVESMFNSSIPYRI